MKEELTSLLDRYYAGETTPEEEILLKRELGCSAEQIPEREIFAYYEAESALPQDLEESLFSQLEEKDRERPHRFRIFSLASMAALFLLLVTLYSDFQQEKRNEKEFILMEQALSKVALSLQPEAEEPDMLVLWVGENVDIIIN